jgi:hypothetical protein
MVDDETQPDEGTRAAERIDAGEAHIADRAPTDEEEAAAEGAAEKFKGDREEAAAHYEELSDIGAHVKGEGRVE